MDEKNPRDHDLIIRVDANLTNLINDFKNYIKTSDDRIADHETRLRRVELYGFISIGFIYAIQFYLTFIR